MFLLEGQIEHIGLPTPYNKKGNEKIDVVILTKNELRNRLEFIKVEFMDEHMESLNEKNLEVGDKVKITFQLVGRKFTKESEEPKYFGNIQGISIEYL